MQINDFSGGLQRRLHPILMAPNEAVIYENVDNAEGVLSPIKGISSGTACEKFFTYYYSEGEWVSFATEASFTEYQGILYYTELNSIPKAYNGTDTYSLGIDSPTVAPTIDDDTIDVTLTHSVLSSSIGGPVDHGLVDGIYEYIVTETVVSGGKTYAKHTTLSVTHDEWYESGTAYTVNISEFTFPTGGGKLYSIYRKGSTGSYHLIFAGNVSNGQVITDNYRYVTGFAIYDLLSYRYVYTYYNSSAAIESAPSPLSPVAIYIDSFVNDSIYHSISNISASADPAVDTIRLYVIGGNFASYTLVDELSNTTQTYAQAWNELDVADNDQLDYLGSTKAPTGLKYFTQAYGTLFGAVGDKLYYSQAGRPSIWPSTYFIQLTEEITGIGVTSLGLLIFSRYRTYLLTGTTHNTFSLSQFSDDQGCVSHYSISYIKNSAIWLSTDGVCISNGGAIDIISRPKLGKLDTRGVSSDRISGTVSNDIYWLSENAFLWAFDLRFNLCVRTYPVNVDFVTSAVDRFYYVDAGQRYYFFDKDYSDDLPATILPLHWKSPEYADGATTNLKKYETVYVRCRSLSGNFSTFRVYLDGAIVYENDQFRTLNFATEVREIKLPTRESYTIQFEVEGEIEIHEIEYKVEGRQNGR